jgi:hypothetical protein
MARKAYEISLEFSLRLNVEDGTDEGIIQRAVRTCLNGFKGFDEHAPNNTYVPDECTMEMKELDNEDGERLFFYDRVQEFDGFLMSVRKSHSSGEPVTYKPEPLPKSEYKPRGGDLC